MSPRRRKARQARAARKPARVARTSAARKHRPRDPYFDVPFVPDLELLERQRARLAPEEAVAVALALNDQLPPPEEQSPWGVAARIESVSQRL